MPTDDEKIETNVLYKQASKAREIEAATKLASDRRNLTLADVVEAGCYLRKGGYVRKCIRKKLEKDDVRLYGLKIGKTTVVSRKKKGKKGNVVKVEMVDGFNKFTVEWPGKKRFSQHDLEDILEMAEDGQGVVSLEVVKEKINYFFHCLESMANVQIHKIILDDTEVEFGKKTPGLTAREKDIDGVMLSREYAWDKITKADGLAMLNEHEIELLKSDEDPDLVSDLRKKSCLHMMELVEYAREGKLGLVNTEFKFHHKQVPKVNHFIRGAQASFKLGRLTNLASSIMFISKKEIPPESKAEDLFRSSPDEADEFIFTPVDAKKYSLGVRALLGRARVRVAGCDEYGGKNPSKCRWLIKYPLYRYLFLSRPDGKTVAPNSENVNVCHTRRQKDAFETVAEMSGDVLKHDIDLFVKLDTKYLLTARDKKNAKERRDRENKGVGLGARVIKGKMHVVGSTEMKDGTNRLCKRLKRNVIEPFMEKLPDRQKNVDTCMKVLLQHKRRVGVEDRGENEDHLYPKNKRVEIDAIVDHMIDKKGDKKDEFREEISLLSRALTLADNHTAAALRDEDTRGQNAFDLDVIEIPGVDGGKKVRLVRCKLPPFFKNRKSMQKKKTGYPVNHVKDESCAEAFVVMVVIARRIMRKLLGDVRNEKEQKMRSEAKTDIEIDEMRQAHTLTEKLAPFSPLGKLYSSTQLGALYEFCGAYTMGLPYYKSHVIRSIHATAVAKLCIKHGLAEDHPSTIKIFNAARQGDDERIAAYSQAMSDMPNREGIEFLWRSTSSALNELNKPVARSSKGSVFKEFTKVGGVGGFQFQEPGGDFGWDGVCDDPLDELERKSELKKGGVERKAVCSTGTGRKNKRGREMQDKFVRRSRLVAEMNRLFVEWVRSYRVEKNSASDVRDRKEMLRKLGRSKSVTSVFMDVVKTEMAKMEDHKAFFEEFYAEWGSVESCRKFAMKMEWESP